MYALYYTALTNSLLTVMCTVYYLNESDNTVVITLFKQFTN